LSVDSRFDALGLSPRSLTAISRLGWQAPTPIQARAIPPALDGHDVIGCAATGTGKTAAFALPILEKIPVGQGSRALILAPTRELVLQIAECLTSLAAGGPRIATVIGGVGMEPQVQALAEGREVIVATPGRLIDHLDRGSARLGKIGVLVLDEADRMLDMGFKPQLERILRKIPAKRQTLLFSATMAGEVAEFAGKHLRAPTRIEVARSGTTAARAEQRVFLVSQEEKSALLLALLAGDQRSTLVFTRTKHRADKLARSLARAGHEAARIHADRSQGQRRAALEGFRNGDYRVLVATDIAARGIDVEDIGQVVNYDLPHVAEDYVHRIGRTARAAASGLALSFCAPDEMPLLRDIERFTRTTLPRAEVLRDRPEFQEELARRDRLRAHPGPRQPGHGVSGRPPGQAPGRHARTHAKKPAAATADRGTHREGPAPRSPARRSTPEAAATGMRIGSWWPKRRR
jgi:ATP-dependent RNA helicase RhlE